MRLRLENIGKITIADIEINGITVIAGENNTGKSTFGKALYSVFNSLYMKDKQIQNEIARSIMRLIDYFSHDYRTTSPSEDRIIANEIYENKSDFLIDSSKLYSLIDNYYSTKRRVVKFSEDNDKDVLVDRIIQRLKISENEIFKAVLTRRLNDEINEQVCNIYNLDHDAKIVLTVRGNDSIISIKRNEVFHFQIGPQLATEAIYIDDPFIIDTLGLTSSLLAPIYHHTTQLKMKLTRITNKIEDKSTIESIINSRRLEDIYRRLSSICDGEIINQNDSYAYSNLKSDATLKIANLSAGLKTFVILKTLLLYGAIEEKGTIILDEPEIHLHPEWQLLFAELIILLQKEFDLHILINTHSPYFLNALEVFASKYEISDKCRYYLAKNIEELSIIEDVTNSIEKIYEKLARPLQKLENERFTQDGI